jgi:hypothetical protein
MATLPARPAPRCRGNDSPGVSPETSCMRPVSRTSPSQIASNFGPPGWRRRSEPLPLSDNRGAPAVFIAQPGRRGPIRGWTGPALPPSQSLSRNRAVALQGMDGTGEPAPLSNLAPARYNTHGDLQADRGSLGGMGSSSLPRFPTRSQLRTTDSDNSRSQQFVVRRTWSCEPDPLAASRSSPWDAERRCNA